MKILVVEDDQTVAQSLKFLFSSYNYAVDIAADGEAGLQMVDAFNYDLILLDVILPKLDGVNLCKRLRAREFRNPILLLTGQGEGRQKAVALNAGADDYVVKPFDAEELVARVQALLRRGSLANQPILTWGNLSIDPSSRRVAYGTQLMSMTPKEYAILELFLRDPHKVLSAAAILDRVWSSVESPGEEAVRVHIKELRQKFRAAGAPKDFIKTVYRVGYQLNPQYSSFLAVQVGQQPTAPNIAELTVVNEELRITVEELQVAEEELRQQNEELTSVQQMLALERQQYQDLFEFAPDAYLVTDLCGHIQEANRAASNLLDVQSQYLIGKPLITFIANPNRSDFRRCLANLNFVQNWEVDVKSRTGELVSVLVAVTSIKNLQNEIVGLRWLLRDIRLRKILEQQMQATHDELEMRVAERTAELVTTIQSLQQQQNQRQSLFDHALDAIAIADNKGYYIDANPAACELFGVSREELLRSCIADFADPQLDVAQVWQQFLQQGQMSGEFRLYRPDGTTRETEFNAIANFVPGRHLSILRDISQRKRSETKLRTVTDELQFLYNDAPCGYHSLDQNGILIQVNDTELKMLGYSRDEMIGKPFSDFLTTESLQTFQANFPRFLQQGQVKDLEFQVICKDGSILPVSLSATAIRDEMGNYLMSRSILVDISERKQLEAERQLSELTVQKSEEQLRLALDLTHTGAWDWDMVTGTVTWTTNQYHLFGYPIGEVEVSYQLWRDRVHPDDIAWVEQTVMEALAAQRDVSVEYRVVLPDGHIRWILTKGRGLYNELGQPIRMLGFNFDISDHKQLEAEQQQTEDTLRLSEEQRRLALDLTNTATWDLDVATGTVVWSNYMFRLFGLPIGVAEPTYLLWRQCVHPDDIERLETVVQTHLQNQTLYSEEYRVVHPDGSIHWVLSKGHGIYDAEGQAVRMIGITMDITDRKQLELSLQTSEAKLNQIFNNADASIVSLRLFADRSVQYDYCSAGSEVIFGYTPAEIMAGMWWSRILPEDQETVILPAQDTIFAEGAECSLTMEYRFQHKDETLRWISSALSSYWDEQNDCWQVTAIDIDITDRKQAEAALRESEELLRLTLAGAQAGSWDWEIETGKLSWSPETYRMYGLDPTDSPLLYEDWYNTILYVDDRPWLNDALMQMVERRQPNTQLEFRIVHPQQGIRWLLGFGHLTLNEQGEPVRLSGINLDITDRKQAEIALRENEELLRFALAGAQAGTWNWDLSTGQITWSLENYALYGIDSTRRPVQYEDWVNALHPEDREWASRQVLQMIEERLPEFQSEFRIIHPQRGVRWMLGLGHLTLNEQGEPIRLSGLNLDITDRKQTEIELLQREEFLNSIYTGVEQAVFVIDVVEGQDFRYLDFNPVSERYSTLTRQQVKGKTPEEAFGQVQGAALRQNYERCLQAGKKITYEEEIIFPGQPIWTLTTLFPFKNEQGETYRIVGTAINITERKHLELSLQTSEAKLNQILDSAFAAISSFRVYANRDWEYEYWSAGCERLFGYPLADYSDKHFWLSQVHPDDLEQTVITLFDDFLAEQDATVEYRFRRKDGVIRWFSSSYTSRKVADDCWVVTAVNYDITARKQAESTLQQQISQAQLIADISQEIRHSLDLNNVLSRTVERVRELLNTDRVVIFCFSPDGQGEVIMESVGDDWTSMLSTTIFDSCFSDRYIELYCQGRIAALSDIDQPGLEPCYVELLKSFQVKANLIVPILRNEELWGLLIAHHCSAPRQWQSSEIELLRQLATHVGIAIQQSELYEQTRHELLERERMQMVLEESEERFRSLSATAPIGICQTNADGICLYVNERWQQMSGLSFEDCLGYGWLQAIHPDDRGFFTTWEAYLRGEDASLPEFRFLTPQGETRWISARVATMKSATDEIIGYVSTCEDITERKQAEMQLRKMSDALSYAVEGIAQLDEQGHYISVNEAYAYTVGYAPDEMIGMPWQNTVYPDDLEQLTEAYQSMLRQGKVELEARGIRKDGSVFYKQVSMVAAYNEQQQLTGHYCFMKDISERKQMEADRKFAEQKIREQAALLDITSDAIFVHDLDFRILYWNQSAERLYGWQAAEAIGQKANELLHSDPTHSIQEIMEILMRQGSWRGEIHKITKTGKQVVIEARWTLVQDEAGQPKHILSVDTDITERKQLEAQFYRAQRLESLGTLASGIAHDLNNVLTPILAISQLLRLHRPIANDQLQEMLKVLEDSARRGAAMIKQILTFTRGTGGERSPVQMAPLLQEVVNVIQQTFPKSINIRKIVPEQPLWLVSADPTYLHQVLMNLCVNARDAMPDGGTLTLSAKNFNVDQRFAQRNLDAQVGNYVMITIADTGSGIPADVRDRIFEPFFTTKALGQGTGLGLSTVLGIIKSYDGFVEVHSQLGVGSQFKVYLPAIETVAQSLERQADLPQGHGELILIVDDEALILQSTQTILETYNYRVLTASNGADAVACYAEHQDEIHTVLIDMMMPEMDGLTAIRALQAMNPQVRVIATSGLAGQYRQNLKTLGITTLLIKPFTTAELLHSIHTQ